VVAVTRADWEPVALRDVAALDIERVAVEPDREYRLAGVLIAGLGVFWRGTIRGRDTTYATLHRLRAGQLVMRKLTAWEGPITTVPAEFDGGYVSSEFPTFSIDESRLLPDYMRLICQRPDFHAEMRARSTGTAERRNRLRPSDLLSIVVALPPLEEQHSIAKEVAAADAAVTACQAERDAGFAMLKAAVETLIVPLGTWDELPEEWQLHELGDVADLRSGITKGRRTTEPLEPAPFLRAANVQDGYLDLTEIKTIEVTENEKQRFRLKRGDVLMIEGGNAEHLGRGWIWSGEVEGCLHQNHVFRARPNVMVVEPRFLAYVIAASPARAYCLDRAKRTTNLASINSTQIRSLPIPVPPRDEQREVVAKLDTIRSAAVAAHHAYERLRQLRSTLVEVLLSGDGRVREVTRELASAEP
jgi:type I restriction enzyme, S subunit